MGGGIKQNSPDVYPVCTMICVDYANASVNNSEEATIGTDR